MSRQLLALLTISNYSDAVYLFQHDGPSAGQSKSISSHYSQHPAVSDCETERVRKKISPMFQTSSKKTKVGPVLETLQNLCDDDLNGDDVCKRLEDLALEQKFTVTYLDLPEISFSGNIILSLPNLMQIATVDFLCSYTYELFTVSFCDYLFSVYFTWG